MKVIQFKQIEDKFRMRHIKCFVSERLRSGCVIQQVIRDVNRRYNVIIFRDTIRSWKNFDFNVTLRREIRYHKQLNNDYKSANAEIPRLRSQLKNAKLLCKDIARKRFEQHYKIMRLKEKGEDD